MIFSAVQCSAVQCSAVQCSVVHEHGLKFFDSKLKVPCSIPDLNIIH